MLELSTVVHGSKTRFCKAYSSGTAAVPNLHNIVLLVYYKTINIVLLGINGGIPGGRRWRTTSD